ncbi:MAG: response regulator [Desulfatitalea sp.]|nr:response regulator [Desulfatitalea sp.]
MRRILAIDDEEQILDFINRVMTHFGYDVMLASDGAEGVEILSNGHSFDMVLTDIGMPIISGYSVAEHIRNSERPETPIVAITGQDKRAINRELFNFVLLKPFRMEALVDVVNFVTREKPLN